ncbi:pilus (MSHA type) biogenesis protein MshL [Shewanella sp. 202IG2-18]|uniref:pilus (MSHA type) biogenesis protein MshL n=1 Tax=Parashewanella hymeniacidonis TaxID=2807618 RepID=UPI0019610CE7|nr:pilus (MSHA type) biogenesis protein MshL [Parashewanella hymeniacidonis]MBM7073083.1 pilus (MSHA type) biogenesis protein MshL [Parashewanella hymeniacidonis]
MTLNIILISCIALSLVGCQSAYRAEPKAAKAELDQAIMSADAKSKTRSLTPPPPLPQAVQQELSADSLLEETSRRIQEKRFDVNAKDVDAKVFFASLVHNSPFSIVVHPQVTGTISLSLKAVTLSEVLQVVQDIYGYEVRRQARILRVYPAGLRTETFPVNYLYMQRQGTSLTSVNSGRISDNNQNNGGSNNNNSNGGIGNNNNSNNNQNGENGNNNSVTNGTFIRTTNETDFWKDLQNTLSSIVGSEGQGRQVVVTPQAGLVTVRAYPDELRQVRVFLSKAESHLQRQVILQAKIIEVTLSDGYQQGIQWQQLSATAGSGGNTSIGFETSSPTESFGNQITRAIGGVAGLTVKGSDFEAMINLLKTQGDVDVLSSPRVTASNNQKAVIKVGSDEYFVTEVSSNVVQSSNGSAPITQPEVELTPFFSGIALDVTPQIDDDGGVLLHVHPSVIDINEQTKSIEIGDEPLVLPLAHSQIRESDTVIKAKTGDVVVIGGLMKTEKVDQVSKVPLLGDIPIIGQAFTNRKKVNHKTELIILLKPTVVGEGSWKTELERSRDLLNRWYPED